MKHWEREVEMKVEKIKYWESNFEKIRAQKKFYGFNLLKFEK